jgi:hypothetical protein
MTEKRIYGLSARLSRKESPHPSDSLSRKINDFPAIISDGGKYINLDLSQR